MNLSPELGMERWEFPKIRVPCIGVLITRILLFRVLYQKLPGLLMGINRCLGFRIWRFRV